MKTREQLSFNKTIEDLKTALAAWDEIPDRDESDLEQFKKKTRDLLIALSEQIKTFDL